MALNSRRALDPRWGWHQRSVPIGHMSVVCEIFRRVGDAASYAYNPDTGGVDAPPMTLLYRGPTRVATNKDWRARVKTIRGDSGVAHAVRFQVEIKTCPPIHVHDVVRVIDSPADQELTHFVFHVRNMMMSSRPWVRNLLCDVDVAHPNLLPPPYEMQPITNFEQAPPPITSGCNCG
jgi:hypothetical protein